MIIYCPDCRPEDPWWDHSRRLPLLCQCPAWATLCTQIHRWKLSLGTTSSWWRAKSEQCDTFLWDSTSFLYCNVLCSTDKMPEPSRGKGYQFDWSFFKRFYHLHGIFFPGLKNVSVFIMLVVTSSLGAEISSCDPDIWRLPRIEVESLG